MSVKQLKVNDFKKYAKMMCYIVNLNTPKYNNKNADSYK